MDDPMEIRDSTAAAPQASPGHTREKRIAKLVLLGMALLVIVVPPSPLVRSLFSLLSALVLVTWIDYVTQDRGKPLRLWMKVVVVLIGLFLAQIYLRIIALILLQMLAGR